VRKYLKFILFVLVMMVTLSCGLPFLGPDDHGDKNTLNSTQTSIPTATTTSTPLPVPTETDTETETETDTEGISESDTQIFSDNGVEIELPSSFVLGDEDQDLTVLMENLPAMGPHSSGDNEELFEENRENITIWGYDEENETGVITSFVVMKINEYSGIPLGIIASFGGSFLGSEADSLEQESLSLDGKDVLRFLISKEEDGVTTIQAVYFFYDANILWFAAFSTDETQINQRLPTFDAAIASFRMIANE